MTRSLMVVAAFISMNANGQGLYPLHAGNVWQYAAAPPGAYFTTRAVGDTVMPGGLTYTRLDGAFGGFLRQDGTRVFHWISTANGERVVYDFAGRTGDTIATFVDFGDTVDVMVLEFTVVDMFGRSLNSWKFLEQSRHTSMYVLRTVVDSIGMSAQQAEAGDFFGLRGAIIDGIQYGTIAGTSRTGGGIPSGFALHQNYPNPFNPSTTIEFDLPRDAFVTLIVFDPLGRTLVHLVDDHLGAGTHRVPFDGTGYSSGVYYYHVTTGDFLDTKPLILLK